MAKKKDKIVIPETAPDLHPEVLQAENVPHSPMEDPNYPRGNAVFGTQLTHQKEQGGTFHAVFTPTWRPEIDCGDHDSVEAAQVAIERTAAEFHRTPFLAWRRESPLVWLASGHDGEVDTNMTIATIKQVG